MTTLAPFETPSAPFLPLATQQQSLLAPETLATEPTVRKSSSNIGWWIAISILVIVAVVLLALVIWLGITRDNNQQSSSGAFSSTAAVTPSTVPEVFVINPTVNGLAYANPNDARAGCRNLGATLATTEQLEEAWRRGAEWCLPSFLSDGSIKHPMQRAVAECGNDRAVITSTGTMGGANCYGLKPVPGTQFVHPFAPNVWSQHDIAVGSDRFAEGSQRFASQ